MAFELKDLPYAKDALEPHMSAETLEFHHGKHHQKYVTTLNGLVEGTEMADKSLHEIVHETAGDTRRAKMFNQAAQVLNHDFFWASMSPETTKPEDALAEAIDRDAGGLEEMKKRFKEAMTGHFGSGWIWLVADKDLKLSVVDTHDAGNPITDGLYPLLTCDVWEHAFYIDYRNDKGAFADAFLNELANWRFAGEQLERVRAGLREAA